MTGITTRTKTKVSSKVKQASGLVRKTKAASASVVIDETISSYAARSMKTYADEVNLDRSVPDLFDGLKTVQRRVLWGAYAHRSGLTKTARIVGDVIGKYHPHGDVSVQDAIETLVHQPTPTILGSGNWGGLLDNAAAMRYTNCMLSNYGGMFFQPDYINKEVTTFVPNYDGDDIEPVSLPAMLPNVLMTGGSGIGVGVTTGIPCFTPESLVEVLTRMLKGEELQPIDYARALKHSSTWGGHFINTKENRKAWLSLFTGSAAKGIKFSADLTILRDEKAIEIHGWPTGLKVDTFVNKVRLLPECEDCSNHEGDIGFRIEMKKDHNYTQFDAFVKKVERLATCTRAFRINVTYRSVKTEGGKVDFDTRFLSISIPKLLTFWLRRRLQLEKASLAYRVRKQDDAIAYTELLIFAATKLDVIFKALRAPDSKAHLVKHLKITPEQADLILELRVRQLSKLDQEAMKKRLSEQKAHKAQLIKWTKAPRGKLLEDFVVTLKAIEKDRKFEGEKDAKVQLV